MNTFTIHFAHTGESQHITAQDWQSAVRSTGRADACVLDKITRPRTGRVSIDATFDADSPMIISCRASDPETSDTDLKSWALACMKQYLDAARAGAQGVTA